VRLTYNFAYATFARTYDDPTPSGAGLLQYDVVAQDRRSVVVQTTMFSTQIQGQPPTGLGHQVGLPGVGEFWFAPQVLAGAEEVDFEGFVVRRMPMEVEGETYDVVRMQSNSDGGEEVWAFEVSSGMLVFYRQALYAADGEQTSANILSLANRRQVKLPWRYGSVPKWVKAGTEIELGGNQVMDMGGPPYIPLPMAVSVRIDKVGSLWSEYTQHTWLNNQALGDHHGATGVAQIFGGLWLPPEALGVLKTGDVLDRDAQTGVTTRVDDATARRIAVSAAGPGYVTRYTYDARTGRLVGYYQEAHFSAGVQYTQLNE
jgi:hypothetical protein